MKPILSNGSNANLGPLMSLVKLGGATTAILILTVCHGGCEGGWANAKVVSRFCQEGNTRKTVIDRRRSKKRARAAVLLMALSQRSWVSSATVWKVKASRLRVARTADRCRFP